MSGDCLARRLPPTGVTRGATRTSRFHPRNGDLRHLQPTQSAHRGLTGTGASCSKPGHPVQRPREAPGSPKPSGTTSRLGRLPLQI